MAGLIQKHTKEARKELGELHYTAARKLEELRLLQQRGPGEPTIDPSRLEKFVSADMEISGIQHEYIEAVLGGAPVVCCSTQGAESCIKAVLGSVTQSNERLC